jgi:hypothetical protein
MVVPDKATTGLIDEQLVVNMLPERCFPSVRKIEYQGQ